MKLIKKTLFVGAVLSAPLATYCMTSNIISSTNEVISTNDTNDLIGGDVQVTRSENDLSIFVGYNGWDVQDQNVKLDKYVWEEGTTTPWHEDMGINPNYMEAHIETTIDLIENGSTVSTEVFDYNDYSNISTGEYLSIDGSWDKYYGSIATFDIGGLTLENLEFNISAVAQIVDNNGNDIGAVNLSGKSFSRKDTTDSLINTPNSNSGEELIENSKVGVSFDNNLITNIKVTESSMPTWAIALIILAVITGVPLLVYGIYQLWEYNNRRKAKEKGLI